MSSLCVVPPPMKASLPLYQIEDLVATFAETAEVVPPEQEAEFLLDFAAVLNQAKDKRDAVGHFMAMLESTVALADNEIRRLQDRKAAALRTLTKLEDYLVRIIDSLGPDAKGKPRKLEGNTVTFSLRKLPPSVKILEETLIPEAYKTASVTLKLPAEAWTAFLDTLDLEARAIVMDGARVTFEPSKTAIKAAIDSDTPVAGAEISAGYRLDRK